MSILALTAVQRVGLRTMFKRNISAPIAQSLPTIGALCCCFWLSSPMAGERPIEPSPEDLSRFVTPYDGESRPDLVPYYRTIEEALAGYESRNAIDSVLSPTDRTLIDNFESAILQSYEEDDRVMGRMLEDLCGGIDELDGTQIAAEITRIDQVLISWRDTRADQLVGSLSTSAAEVLRAEATEVAKLFAGSNTDAVALAKEFPGYVKERYVERCTALGHITRGGMPEGTGGEP
jgi:hypothetical protein